MTGRLSASKRALAGPVMLDMFHTPLRSAALGISLAALVVLVLGASDRLIRMVDRQASRPARDARRERFRTHGLILLAGAIGCVLASEVIQ